jgi:uncharacterized protein YPO0396
MSHSRVTLSRIIAVNWYGYRQIIDVQGLTLITGANGSGKSALLDLIQFVMLGEAQSRFNKAAAGAGSGRSLRGYCLCDTNTTGRDGQERYLRTSGVTLAALEFSWPLQAGQTQPRRETWGARMEYEGPSAKASTLWFHTTTRLAWQDFLREEGGPQAMQFTTEEEFRTHVRRDLEGDAWDRQQTYLSEMATRMHLGFDERQMAKTLPRAMAFEPESNFEKFVRDFLLEPGLPDVRGVKASVDAHRRAQERLTKMKDQLDRLTRISLQHQSWKDAQRESLLYTHLADALRHEEALEILGQRKAKLEDRRTEHTEQQQAYEQALVERDELRRRTESARAALGDTGVKLEENRNQRREVEAQLRQLTELASAAREQLRQQAKRWEDWLKLGKDLGLTTPAEAGKELALLRGTDEVRGLEAADRIIDVYHTLRAEAEEHLRPLEAQVAELDSRTSTLRRDVDQLREGHATPAHLLNALRARGQRAAALGRVIEVKPEAEAWWPLLEALLDEDRQAILPEDFRAAWELAQKTPSTEPLINPEELALISATAKPGSLSDMFSTQHPLAARWLEVHLGDVMPVRSVKELDKHMRALSKDGWLKDPPHRTKLTPSKELTLGEEGLRRLRELRMQQLRSLETELSDKKRTRDDWRTFLHRGKDWQLNDFDPPAGSTQLSQLPRLRNLAQQLDSTYELMATPDSMEALQTLRSLEASFDGAKERLIRLDERMAGFKQFEREQQDSISAHTEQEQQSQLARQQSRQQLTGVLDSEITERISAARQQSSSWRKAVEMAHALAAQREAQARDARRLRDEARRDLLLPQHHPELADALDPAETDNNAFEQRRRDLETHELERFQAAAAEAKKDWEERLQHQVLDVLREKLGEAERTKRELNKAMDHEIGGWRYQLTSRADRAHSAIWTLVEKGLPSGPDMELFQQSAREEIDKAKQELMAAIDMADHPTDLRQQRALDYRYYHHWDIQARPAGRSDAAAISLNKSAKKQSGGENQAPFFVATLAAFRRVYDTGRKEDPQNLGLVVMDEAFSKLSGDRIDDCLGLAQNFGLQLIMAFPEDRLPTMFQHADTVVQCRVERSYDPQTEQVTKIENWVVRVEGARLAELIE